MDYITCTEIQFWYLSLRVKLVSAGLAHLGVFFPPLRFIYRVLLCPFMKLLACFLILSASFCAAELEKEWIYNE